MLTKLHRQSNETGMGRKWDGWDRCDGWGYGTGEREAPTSASWLGLSAQAILEQACRRLLDRPSYIPSVASVPSVPFTTHPLHSRPDRRAANLFDRFWSALFSGQ